MPKNKVANIVADYIYLKGGQEVCEVFLEAIDFAKERNLDLKLANLEDLAESIQHNLRGGPTYERKGD